MGQSSSKSDLSLTRGYQKTQEGQNEWETVWRNKSTNQIFLVKELSFPSGQAYEQKLEELNQMQEIEQSQNILNLVKVWSEEHHGICSNMYKVFPMYEYSSISLRDEIEARKKDCKCFEEQEIISIIQSSINSLNSQQQLILLSPKAVYIAEEGLLKTINCDLFDYQVLESFSETVYYSPEKMVTFADTRLSEEQAVFSLGMTVLECLTLESQLGLYDPFNSDISKRFNHKKCLQVAESTLVNMSEFTRQLVLSMLLGREERISLKELKEALEETGSTSQERTTSEESSSLWTQKEETAKKSKRSANNNLNGCDTPINELNMFTERVFNPINQINLDGKKHQEEKPTKMHTIEELNQSSIHSQTAVVSVNSIKPTKVNISAVNSKNITSKNSRLMCEAKESQAYIDPVCKQNNLFTNPEFLAAMKRQVANFPSTKAQSSMGCSKTSQMVFHREQTGINSVQNSHVIVVPEQMRFQTGMKRSHTQRLL